MENTKVVTLISTSGAITVYYDSSKTSPNDILKIHSAAVNRAADNNHKLIGRFYMRLIDGETVPLYVGMN